MPLVIYFPTSSLYYVIWEVQKIIALFESLREIDAVLTWKLDCIMSEKPGFTGLFSSLSMYEWSLVSVAPVSCFGCICVYIPWIFWNNHLSDDSVCSFMTNVCWVCCVEHNTCSYDDCLLLLVLMILNCRNCRKETDVKHWSKFASFLGLQVRVIYVISAVCISYS